MTPKHTNDVAIPYFFYVSPYWHIAMSFTHLFRMINRYDDTFAITIGFLDKKLFMTQPTLLMVLLYKFIENYKKKYCQCS